MLFYKRVGSPHHLLKKRWPEIAIALVALFLYIYQLGTESFWIDEILSVESAQGPLNLNRPLYFILLRGWMFFGQSDLWLRTLSMLFGLGSIILTYQLGQRIANRNAGRISALLLTLSPLAINHSQEVRFYMMSTFLGLAGSLYLHDLLCWRSHSAGVLRPPSTLLKTVTGWIIFRCLGFLTAQPNVLLLIPDLILIVWKAVRTSRQSGQFQLRYWLSGLVLLSVPIAIIFSDVIPELLEFLSYTTHTESTKPGIANLIGKLSALTIWPLRGPEIASFSKWLEPAYRHLFNLYSVLSLGLIATGFVTAITKSPKLLQVFLWGLLPIFAIFIASQAFPVLWKDRYALLSAPYLLILLAAVWTQLWHQCKPLAILIGIIYCLSVSGPLIRYYTLDYHADWRGLAEELTLNAQPNEPVLVYPGSLVEIIDYYYEGDANFLPMDKVIAAEDLEVEEAIALIQNAEWGGDRFWLICPVVDRWSKVKDDLIAQIEQEEFVLEQERYLLDQWAWGPALYLFSR